MKTNRKKRSLKYIRDKNNLRNSGQLTVSSKMTKETIHDDEYLRGFIDSFISNNISILEKKFKMSLKCIDLKFGICHGDFSQGIFTLVIKIKKK